MEAVHIYFVLLILDGFTLSGRYKSIYIVNGKVLLDAHKLASSTCT